MQVRHALGAVLMLASAGSQAGDEMLWLTWVPEPPTESERGPIVPFRAWKERGGLWTPIPTEELMAVSELERLANESAFDTRMKKFTHEGCRYYVIARATGFGIASTDIELYAAADEAWIARRQSFVTVRYTVGELSLEEEYLWVEPAFAESGSDLVHFQLLGCPSS